MICTVSNVGDDMLAAHIAAFSRRRGHFTRSLLGDEELEQVVTYVAFLQDPGAPGGAPISWVGSVSEGAVAWLVGMPALLLALRWIGRRDD